jgi:hypothetical protein
LWNAPQADYDFDGLGDACDPNADNDLDPKQTDCDDLDAMRSHLLPEDCFNGIDDDCDGWADQLDLACGAIDSDGDTVADIADNCPSSRNPTQSDLDRDGIGDTCDPDADGDGLRAADGDCNDLKPGELRSPDEVVGLRVRLSAGILIATWDSLDPAWHGSDLRYAIVGGTLGPVWDPLDPFQDHACRAYWVAGGEASIWVPGSHWILVRASLPSCGSGTYGRSSLVPDSRQELDSIDTCP